MSHKYKCPVCGTTVHRSTLDKFYQVNFFKVHGLGRGKGFSFEKVEDPSLLEAIKNKISTLFHRFFDNLEEAIVVPIAPVVIVEKIRMDSPSIRSAFVIKKPSTRSKFVIKEKMTFDLR